MSVNDLFFFFFSNVAFSFANVVSFRAFSLKRIMKYVCFCFCNNCVNDVELFFIVCVNVYC